MALGGFVLLGLVSQAMQVDGVPPLWLPSGLACAFALRWGWRVMPGLWLGAVLLAIALQSAPLSLALLQGSLASIEPLMVVLVAHLLLPRRDPFASMSQLLVFLMACWLGGLLTIVSGQLLLDTATWLPPVLSRLAGLLLLAPLLLSCFEAPRAELPAPLLRWDWWLLVGAMVLFWALIQGGWLPLLRLTPMVPILPLLVLAACRFQLVGLTLLLVVFGVIELWIPFHTGAGGVDRFNGLGLQTMQRLVVYGQLMALMVLVANQERRRLVAGLEAQALRLERQVEERTRELVAANARLERLSHCDSLTGIANRRRFEQVLQREWAQARQGGDSLTVVVFDVDHFKAYNDHYGHPAGDRVLRRVARSLAAALRPEERHRIARYGGEEFVLVLSGLADEAVVALAETLRSSVSTLAIPHGVGGSEGVVTLSGGLATCVAQPGRAPKEVVAAADAMLYAAKAAGRNRLCVHPGAPVA